MVDSVEGRAHIEQGQECYMTLIHSQKHISQNACEKGLRRMILPKPGLLRRGKGVFFKIHCKLHRDMFLYYLAQESQGRNRAIVGPVTRTKAVATSNKQHEEQFQLANNLQKTSRRNR